MNRGRQAFQISRTLMYNSLLDQLRKIPFLGKKFPHSLHEISRGNFLLSLLWFFQWIKETVETGVYFLFVFGLSEKLKDLFGSSQGQSTLFFVTLFFTSVCMGTFFKSGRIPSFDEDSFVMVKIFSMSARTWYLTSTFYKLGRSLFFYALVGGTTLFLLNRNPLGIISMVLLLGGLRVTATAVEVALYTKRRGRIGSALFIGSMVLFPVLMVIFFWKDLPGSWVSFLFSPVTGVMSLFVGALSVRYLLRYRGYQNIAAETLVTGSYVDWDKLAEEGENPTWKEGQTTSTLKGFAYLHEVYFQRIEPTMKTGNILGGVFGLGMVFLAEFLVLTPSWAYRFLLLYVFFYGVTFLNTETFSKGLFFHMDRFLFSCHLVKEPLSLFLLRVKLTAKLFCPRFLVFLFSAAMGGILLFGPTKKAAFIVLLCGIGGLALFFHGITRYHGFNPYADGGQGEPFLYSVTSTRNLWIFALPGTLKTDPSTAGVFLLGMVFLLALDFLLVFFFMGKNFTPRKK